MICGKCSHRLLVTAKYMITFGLVQCDYQSKLSLKWVFLSPYYPCHFSPSRFENVVDKLPEIL